MPRYKVLPHTADLRLKVYGEDFEEILENSAYGLSKILYGDVDKKIKYIRGAEKIEIESKNKPRLLVDFLNELLSLSNIEKKVFPQVKILKLSPTSLVAEARGVGVDHFDEDVKAVSHHEAGIEGEGSNLEAVLTLDI